MHQGSIVNQIRVCNIHIIELFSPVFPEFLFLYTELYDYEKAIFNCCTCSCPLPFSLFYEFRVLISKTCFKFQTTQLKILLFRIKRLLRFLVTIDNIIVWFEFVSSLSNVDTPRGNSRDSSVQGSAVNCRPLFFVISWCFFRNFFIRPHHYQTVFNFNSHNAGSIFVQRRKDKALFIGVHNTQ